MLPRRKNRKAKARVTELTYFLHKRIEMDRGMLDTACVRPGLLEGEAQLLLSSFSGAMAS
jgi:hypothetical protein